MIQSKLENVLYDWHDCTPLYYICYFDKSRPKKFFELVVQYVFHARGCSLQANLNSKLAKH